MYTNNYTFTGFPLGGISVLRPLPRAAAVLTSVAACTWSIAIANVWVPMPGRAMPLFTSAAGAASVIAALCWLAVPRRKQDRDMGLLIRTLANVTRPAAEVRTTLPLRRVQ